MYNATQCNAGPPSGPVKRSIWPTRRACLLLCTTILGSRTGNPNAVLRLNAKLINTAFLRSALRDPSFLIIVRGAFAERGTRYLTHLKVNYPYGELDAPSPGSRAWLIQTVIWATWTCTHRFTSTSVGPRLLVNGHTWCFRGYLPLITARGPYQTGLDRIGRTVGNLLSFHNPWDHVTDRRGARRRWLPLPASQTACVYTNPPVSPLMWMRRRYRLPSLLYPSPHPNVSHSLPTLSPSTIPLPSKSIAEVVDKANTKTLLDAFKQCWAKLANFGGSLGPNEISRV